MTTTPLFFTPHLHPNKYAHTSMKTTLKTKGSIESIISITLQMNHGFPHTHTRTTKKKNPSLEQSQKWALGISMKNKILFSIFRFT